MASVPEETDNPWAYYHQDTTPAASDIFLPLGSLVLPGLGQWSRGQRDYGALYTGVAIGGAAYSSLATKDLSEEQIKNPGLDDKNIALRKYMLGLQTSQSMGGFSLYHTFRSAVWQRQAHGQYGFLGKGDSPRELFLAPFAFENLTRSSTYIPLAVVLGIGIYQVNHPPEGYHKSTLTGADAAFAGGFSYNAGTHEEAIFRGWMMPVIHEAGMSPFMSNLTQATAFALAHLGSNPMPLPQFLLGMHLGRVSQNRGWSLQESIFIHTWWDVIAFTANYYVVKNKPATASARGRGETGQKLAPLLLPAVNLVF
jgi:membrane protease YdiL (CAAX protease family)